MTGKDHNKLLSIFFFIQGGLQLLGGIIVGLIYGGLGGMMLANSQRDQDQVMGGIFLVLAVVIGIMILAFGGFYLLTAFKMLKEKTGGRILGIIASCLALLNFPLGTALGIYGLWFLFGDVGKNFYLGLNMGNTPNYTPPPPNSWQ